MSVGAGYWRSEGGSQIDAPMLAAAYGVANRVQLSATVPFYRVSYQGATASGLDDVYLSAKIAAFDPSGDRRFGLAISPTLEILSAGFMEDRLHWALPVSVDLGSGSTRVYGSAGYFSRGAVFAGGAIEWTAPAGTVLTGAITQSSSLGDASTFDASGRGKRVDVSAGIAHPVRNAVAAYASVGRTLTPASEGGTSLALSGGISLYFARASSKPRARVSVGPGQT